MDIKTLWAKTNPFQSVHTHALISGKVAQLLFDYYLSPGMKELLQNDLTLQKNELRNVIGYLVSVHDIGKIEYSFQSKDPATREALQDDSSIPHSLLIPGVRHERTGARSLCSIWWSIENEDSIDIFSSIVGAHHPGRAGRGNFQKKTIWSSIQEDLEKECCSFFLNNKLPRLPVVDEHRQGSIGAILLGITILSDWISSSAVFQDAESWIDDPSADNIIFDTVTDFLQRSGMLPLKTSWHQDFCGIWPNIPESGKRPLQSSIETLFNDNKKYSIILLEAPMGEGKTEAGLYAALQLASQWKKDGLYFALPTAATANQMVDRIRSFMSMHDIDAGVRLLHSMAWMENSEDYSSNSPDESDQIGNWLMPSKRSMLGQYSVGTIDQAMLAATTSKYGMLRLLGLSNKALIIDEIHSYDAYMSKIIIRLLEWCKALEIPVIMLSATLPPKKKKELFAPFTTHQLSNTYPLITAISPVGEIVEERINATSHKLQVNVEFLPHLRNIDQIADSAINMVTDGGCICVLLNTVREAQEVYEKIRAQYDGDLLLFHAQFTAEDRARIEEECIRRYGKDKSNRPSRSILVATQVVEQSLDVDFDSMISAVAPIDLLIQRLGRIHRHDNSQRPEALSKPSIKILIPNDSQSFGSSSYVYPECLLKSCIRVLSKSDLIKVPEDVQKLVQDGYDPELVPEEELSEWIENQIKEQIEAGASQQYLANNPNMIYNALFTNLLYEDDAPALSVATRLGEATTRVALLPEDLFEIVSSYAIQEDDTQYVDIWNKSVAESVMMKSVSVRISRLGKDIKHIFELHGSKLLSGTHMARMEGTSCILNNGKILKYDRDIGLLIEDGLQ